MNAKDRYTIIARAFLKAAYHIALADGIARKEFAKRVGITQRQVQEYIRVTPKPIESFFRWFMICNELEMPAWQYFRGIVAVLAEHPVPFEQAKGKSKKSREYKACLQCLAVKEVIRRGIVDSGQSIATIAWEASIDEKRLGKITDLTMTAMPDWDEWLDLCEILKFPEWEGFLVFLNEEYQARVSNRAAAKISAGVSTSP
jgi:hypothetical protein